MTPTQLAAVLEELHLPGFLRGYEQSTTIGDLTSQPPSSLVEGPIERLPRTAYALETLAVSAYERWLSSQDPAVEATMRSTFRSAFICWRGLALEKRNALESSVSSAPSNVYAFLPEERIRPHVNLAFRLALSGILSQTTAETRLELGRIPLPAAQPTAEWPDKVADEIFTSFALLVRKARGWGDILDAIGRIQSLKALQAGEEGEYLETLQNKSTEIPEAVRLVGFYHLAQLVILTAEYLKSGDGAQPQLVLRLDRHRDHAHKAFSITQSPTLIHMADLLWVGCRELSRNSIWAQVSGLGSEAKQLARALTSTAREAPVLELWPSQQVALRQGLLDPYWRSIVVEMPTSSGKTLLAKFLAVQTLALNPTGTVAYVVPTRALVNQVTRDFRSDLKLLRDTYTVEQAVAAYELDPTEDRLLAKAPNVLVTTPEKLDLLIKRDHPSTSDIALVIADEAHNLRDKSRGARLELLLGLVKRDRPEARFLLLSPFMPNSDEIAVWLGEDRALLPTIHLRWRPSRRIVGIVDAAGRAPDRALVLETLAAADNSDIDPGIRIPLGAAPGTSPKTLEGLTKATVLATASAGTVLVLSKGPLTAIHRAEQLAQLFEPLSFHPKIDAAAKYADTEAGGSSPLAQCLRHGVAYHHSGLSHECRWLVEDLIRQDLIRVVCGTTTLAQGVNFPIRTIVIETLRKGTEDLDYEDLWNIAGRAGRTMMDTLGLIAFPARNLQDRERINAFLKTEAAEVSSRLASLIGDADLLAGAFNMDAMRRWPQLSALLQFMAHAMKVAGSDSLAADVEDILRSSLVYHQAMREDPPIARRLVDICSRYLQSLQGRRGLAVLADATGFATPSVLHLLERTRGDEELSQPPNWLPPRLFGLNLDPLTERIAAIAVLPEIELGQGTEPPFNPRLVAAILRDWVNGTDLKALADSYWKRDADPTARLAHFSTYLFSGLLAKASWGLGALQSISLAGKDLASAPQSPYIPSMVYFGVGDVQSVWLRMAGVPRIVAPRLAENWLAEGRGEPQDYDQIRHWVSSLTDDQWGRAIPKASPLAPEDMRYVWSCIAG